MYLEPYRPQHLQYGQIDEHQIQRGHCSTFCILQFNESII